MSQTLSLDRFFLYQFSRVANTVSHGTAQLVAERFGLALREARLLVVLGALKEATAAELASATAMDKAPVSRALSNLIDFGLVEREPDPTDGRRALLQLSPKGQQMHDVLVPALLQREAMLLACLTASERNQMLHLLAKLGRHTEAFPEDNAANLSE